MISDTNNPKALDKADVSSSDFRIVEYKDHFIIEKKVLKDVWFYFLWIHPLYIKGKKENWQCILKDNSYLSIRNCIQTKNYQFKTKEECLEWISDYNKYPVYHYR
jgi:hypothetical protein